MKGKVPGVKGGWIKGKINMVEGYENMVEGYENMAERRNQLPFEHQANHQHTDNQFIKKHQDV